MFLLHSVQISVCAHGEGAGIQNGACIYLFQSVCELLTALLCCFSQMCAAFICARWAMSVWKLKPILIQLGSSIHLHLIPATHPTDVLADI